MVRLAALLIALMPTVVVAQTAIVFEYDAGATLYARIYTSSSTAVAAAMTAGTGGNTRLYRVSSATLTGAGLGGTDNYPFTIFLGTPSTSAGDTAVGYGNLSWNIDRVDPVASQSSLDDVASSATQAASEASSASGRALAALNAIAELVIPTANQNGAAAKTAIEQAGGVLANLFARVPDGGRKMAAAGDTAKTLDQVTGGGGGLTIPVNQVAVPESRLFILEQVGTSLIAKTAKGLRVGEPAVFAIDFRNDLAANGRIVALNSVEQSSGPADGMSWSLDTPENAGIDKQQGKLRLTANAEGTYTLLVTVTRSAQDGGGQATGKITLVAVQ